MYNVQLQNQTEFSYLTKSVMFEYLCKWDRKYTH